jgi:TRAP-type C4-dicarboxylate transport system substrate-binding protein
MVLPMKSAIRRWSVTALIAAGTCAGIASAHPHGEQWALANEYPANSLTAEGDAHFAGLVADATRGSLSIVTMPDAKLGYKSREQLAAVAEGKVAMADSFGGAIAADEPIFGLSSLPFVATGARQARALYDAARPAYERAFERRRQKLLYATPWPPTGLWTRKQATSVEAVSHLRIRTYDATGTDLFARVAAAASVVSFADLPPRLESGDIDAVLSSGDGGAGRKLWDALPHFSEINYAIPLSFTTVNLAKWKSLDAKTRKAVEAAAAATEARQWQAVERRVFENYQRMRAHDMSIHPADEIDADLVAKLREAGRAAVEDWAAKAGPEGRALLEIAGK